MLVTIRNVPGFTQDMFSQTSPDGVQVVAQEIVERRGVDVSVNIDVHLVIDVGRISVPIVVGWLVSRLRLFPESELYIDRQQVLIDSAKIQQALGGEEADEHHEEQPGT